jgi:hypothetical protein
MDDVAFEQCTSSNRATVLQNRPSFHKFHESRREIQRRHPIVLATSRPHDTGHFSITEPGRDVDDLGRFVGPGLRERVVPRDVLEGVRVDKVIEFITTERCELALVGHRKSRSGQRSQPPSLSGRE